MKVLVVLVCGGREFADRAFVYRRLDVVLQEATNGGLDLEIIEGGARGVDRLARDWAELHGVRHATFAALWIRYGKKAGPIRNQRMLDEGKPDFVLAFPGGFGTADMIAKARAAGVRVLEVSP